MTKRKVDRETVLKVCKVLGVVLVCASLQKGRKKK